MGPLGISIRGVKGCKTVLGGSKGTALKKGNYGVAFFTLFVPAAVWSTQGKSQELDLAWEASRQRQ